MLMPKQIALFTTMIIVTSSNNNESFSTNNANYCDSHKNDRKNINSNKQEFYIGTDMTNIIQKYI